MPGHKRKTGGEALSIVRKRDITEIRGYDDLHHPTGIIRQSMDQMKEIYGSLESWYLVNGSTLGILVSIASVCEEGDKILIARNCHQSVYHAIRLLRLRAVYVYPEISEENEIFLSVDPSKVKRIIDKDPEIKAVVITSPTYEGVVSDIRTIKDTVGNIPLIVDEAHGAHLIFSEYFPKSAVECGADLVVQSCHKTLPCLTQTAVLHLCSPCVPISRINDMLDVFETSSPSYILLSSAEYGIQYMQENVDIVEKYVDNLKLFRRNCEDLRNIQLFYPQNTHCYTYDCGKLVFSIKEELLNRYPAHSCDECCTEEKPLNGNWLFEMLLNQYGIEMEMESLSYVVGMTSVMDDVHDFDVLLEALKEIDTIIDNLVKSGLSVDMCKVSENRCYSPKKVYNNEHGTNAFIMESWEALSRNRQKEALVIDEAVGRVAAAYVMIYPPGIPFLVPGEKIRKETVENIRYYLYNGYNVKGLDHGRLEVLCEDDL